MSRGHVVGFAAGLLAAWAYHHFVKPMPGAKSS
jgi:hypothetical protein